MILSAELCRLVIALIFFNISGAMGVMLKLKGFIASLSAGELSNLSGFSFFLSFFICCLTYA